MQKCQRPRSVPQLMRRLGAMAALFGVLAVAAPALAAPDEWRVVASPDLGSTSSTLVGVSCLLPGRCVAVGGTATEALIETGNVIAWSRVPAPPTPSGVSSAHLAAVSCASAKFCAAAGSQFILGPTPDSTRSQALIDTWNGRECSVLETPNPAGGEGPTLNGVSCIPWGSCAAVGSDKTASGSQTLVETSQGDKWSLAPSANGAGGQSELGGVSCVPFLFLWQSCVAVGSDTATPTGPPQTLAESRGIF